MTSAPSPTAPVRGHAAAPRPHPPGRFHVACVARMLREARRSLEPAVQLLFLARFPFSLNRRAKRKIFKALMRLS
jgi:hypothetical protein